MNRPETRDLLLARPFQPIRTLLSNGVFFAMPHPEFAMVAGRLLYIAEDPENPDYSHVARLSLPHITHTTLLERERA